MNARVIACALLVACAVPQPAQAQGTARSLDIDASVRSSGMGGASNAVFWGDDPNYWANPAMLGYHRGVRYEWSDTQLVPGLAADVTFRTFRYTAAAGGIGIALLGRPQQMGGINLDYGTSQGVDSLGNPTGTFDSFERIHSWGLGASLGEAVATVARLTGHAPPAITRYVDVALGYSEKRVVLSLAPGEASATTGKDHGFLLRAGVPFAPGGAPLRVDGAYGYSVLNYNDDAVMVFPNQPGTYPTSRIFRSGVAGRVALGLPPAVKSELLPGRWHWLAEGLDPIASVGLAYDGEHVQAGSQGGGYDVQRWGTELILGNVFGVRFGHVEDKLGDISGATSGWSVGLPLGRVAGIRYDHATIPQARDSGLPNVNRHALTTYFDPLALGLGGR
jgi:hypothetical protein